MSAVAPAADRPAIALGGKSSNACRVLSSTSLLLERTALTRLLLELALDDIVDVNVYSRGLNTLVASAWMGTN